MYPLVTTEWLAARIEEPRLRVVDCRFPLEEHAAGRAAYEAGHIPGARALPVETGTAPSKAAG